MPLSKWNGALERYNFAVEQRKRVRNEKERAPHDARVDLAFWMLMTAPVLSPEEVTIKGTIMMQEYGQTGEIRTDLVEILLKDVAALGQYRLAA